MDQDERNMEENNEPAGANGGQEDDDFGEFERFEGGIEQLQAQPASSPWATFPDLLPVQTSPATPAEESQSSSSMRGASSSSSNARDGWHPPAASGASWGGPSNMEESRSVPQPLRTLNPPDVSLGTNQGAGGRVTPDNVHDAAQAEVMNHVNNVLALDARLPVVQLDLLQQQLGDVEYNRAILEEQVDQLRQRNLELEAEVTNSQAQINELNVRLQRNQESLEQRIVEMGRSNVSDIRYNLQQMQEEISSIRDAQDVERRDLEATRRHIEQLKIDINDKFQSLESNMRREYMELEQRLNSRFGEECLQIRSAIESIVQQSVQQFSTAFTQIVMDTLQNNSDIAQGSHLLLQIKSELERHEERQKKTLEEERRRQLSTMSNALQSALQHISGAMNNTAQKGQGETP